MKVDEVIAAFLRGDYGSSQNLRSDVQGNGLFLVLTSYGEAIAARHRNDGVVFIDMKSKYTNTTSRHRNTLVAFCGGSHSTVTRDELRKMVGLPDVPPMAKGKMPYRKTGGAVYDDRPVEMTHSVTPQQAKAGVVQQVDDPLSMVLPAPGNVQILVSDVVPPDAAFAQVVRASEELVGPDVCIVHRENGAWTTYIIDDEANRIVIKQFGIGQAATIDQRRCLHEALSAMGFDADSKEVGRVLRLGKADVTVILASGAVTEYSTVPVLQ